MMDTTITAIYQQGAFYPIEPLELPESTMVQVQVGQPASANVPVDPFHQYLLRLHAALPRFTQTWSEAVVQQTFAKLFRDDLQTVWVLSSFAQRDLCAMLLLATQNLHETVLSPQQVVAIRFVLDKIAQADLTAAEIDECHDKLHDADLYLTFSLNSEALQSYLDES